MHLERLITILEIAGHMGDATVADICASSDLPKPTAYRLVQDLVAAGLLDPVGRGRFAIGLRLKRIAQPEQSDRALLSVIAPALKEAANTHGAAFFLSRLRGRSVEITHVETPDNGTSYLHPGLGKRPLHACSCSKAIAAFLPEADLTRDLDERLRAYTEFTLTRIGDLEAEFRAIRERGYAECVEEIERGMCSVAVPIDETGAAATLSIGAAGSSRVFTPAFRERMGEVLIKLAADLSPRLGLDDHIAAIDKRTVPGGQPAKDQSRAGLAAVSEPRGASR